MHCRCEATHSFVEYVIEQKSNSGNPWENKISQSSPLEEVVADQIAILASPVGAGPAITNHQDALFTDCRNLLGFICKPQISLDMINEAYGVELTFADLLQMIIGK